MSRKTFLTLSASLLLGAVIAAPNAALAQFGPASGSPPMLAGPPALGAGGLLLGLGVGPPLGGPAAEPVAGFRATSPVVRLISIVLADCMV
jgi:hypothetical protein